MHFKINQKQSYCKKFREYVQILYICKGYADLSMIKAVDFELAQKEIWNVYNDLMGMAIHGGGNGVKRETSD